MLSGRLIQLLESHQEQVTNNVIGEIRHHPDMSKFRKLPDAELRERAQTILEHLGHWLSDGHKVEMEQRYQCWEKSVSRSPFHSMNPCAR